MRLLNAALTLVVMTTAGNAHADTFGELLAGISLPFDDSNWTNTANSSPDFSFRGGVITPEGIGGMLQLDWTPVNLDNSGGSVGGVADSNIAAHRFRLLANFVYQHHILPKLVGSARVGVGLDIAHASATVTVLGNTSNTSDTDTAFAFELGGGLWYDLGDVQVGGEIAMPVSAHGKHGDGTNGNYSFDYTSYDINLLLGVRLFSR
jgi:hypothetical protein